MAVNFFYENPILFTLSVGCLGLMGKTSLILGPPTNCLGPGNIRVVWLLNVRPFYMDKFRKRWVSLKYGENLH